MIITGISYVEKSGGAEKALRHLLINLRQYECRYYEYSTQRLYVTDNDNYKYHGVKSQKWVDDTSDYILIFDLTLGLKWSRDFFFSKTKIIISERAHPSRFSFLVRKYYNLLMLISRANFVFQTEDARGYYVLPPRKSGVIENFIINKSHSKFTTNRKEIDILIPGRICAEKGWDQASHVFNVLDRCEFIRRIVVIGDGNLEDYISVGDYENLSIDFLNYVEDIENYYLQSKAVLSLSRLEGYPNVIIEAMSFGLTVITLRSTPILNRILPAGNILIQETGELSEEVLFELFKNHFYLGFNNFLRAHQFNSMNKIRLWQTVLEQ